MPNDLTQCHQLLLAAYKQAVQLEQKVTTSQQQVGELGAGDGSFQGYFWTYIGDDQHPHSVYDFTASRSRDGAAIFLQGHSGYLHADAYAGYDAIFSGTGSDVVEVACWSHARRKFFEAVKSCPRESHQVLERMLRHQAIGRKNWLFLGTETAGPRAAVLYTILAGAKRHRIEPWVYVRDLLVRLHADDPRL